jgi:seryl-tRNA(Sec) selenium transferase
LTITNGPSSLARDSVRTHFFNEENTMPDRELRCTLHEIDGGTNNRRSFLKLLAAAPLFATLATRKLAAATTATGKFTTTSRTHSLNSNLYTELGVRPFINGRGTWTYLSGSLELPLVRKAAEEASHYFVDIYELQTAAGAYLAKMSGAEDGMVTSGSAGAMSSAVAGCMAGTDPKRIYQLPDATGMKNEVIIMGGRSPFDNALRLPGAKLIVAKDAAELKGLMTISTAMVYTTQKGDRLQEVLNITRPAGVPVLLDDAAGIPPFDNFTNLVKTGVDLICFSGGKGLCGPQSSGIMIGRKDLITAARYNSSPWEGAVCRPMKVGKEEIMGVLAAIDYWSKADLGALNKEWQSRVDRIKKMIDTVPGVTSAIATPLGGNSYPTLTVSWDESKWNFTTAQCDAALRANTPRIEVLTASNPSGVLARDRVNRPPNPNARPNHLQIISMTIQPGEELIVGASLRRILNDARKAASA